MSPELLGTLYMLIVQALLVGLGVLYLVES